MNSRTNFFDELAKAFSGAAGVAQGLRKEIDSLVAAQIDRVVSDLDLVRREEFEVVRDMASRARQEVRALKTRIVELEAEIARLKGETPAAGAAADDGRDDAGDADH